MKFSYNIDDLSKQNVNQLGKKVLGIWNKRVDDLLVDYREHRTVVLLRSESLEKFVVFEIKTKTINDKLYIWKWNKNKNLEGYEKSTNKHRFTWQPHGSQFTIIHDFPKKYLLIEIKRPPKIAPNKVLKEIKFDKSWITAFEK